MEIKLALKVNDKDNVATIFANGITDGTEVEIRDKKGNAETVMFPMATKLLCGTSKRAN